MDLPPNPGLQLMRWADTGDAKNPGAVGTLASLKRRASQRARVLVGAVTVMGCGDRTTEPDVPEYRVDACERWCPVAFDPVCGNTDLDPEDAGDCVEGCSKSDAVWVRGPDGVDRCASEHIAYVDCVVELTCEEQARHFAGYTGVVDPAIPCFAEVQAKRDCSYPLD